MTRLRDSFQIEAPPREPCAEEQNIAFRPGVIMGEWLEQYAKEWGCSPGVAAKQIVCMATQYIPIKFQPVIADYVQEWQKQTGTRQGIFLKVCQSIRQQLNLMAQKKEITSATDEIAILADQLAQVKRKQARRTKEARTE